MATKEACQSMSVSIDRKPKTILNAELPQNRRQLVAHDCFADAGMIGDDLLLQPLPDQLDDLPLANGERFDLNNLRVDGLAGPGRVISFKTLVTRRLSDQTSPA
jgi:hypothetical protein